MQCKNFIPLWVTLILAGWTLFAQENATPATELPDPLMLHEKDGSIRASQADEEQLEPAAEVNPISEMEILITERVEVSPTNLPCPLCDDFGFVVAESPQIPYILFETDRPSKPEVSLGHIPCPECDRGANYETVLKQEQARILGRHKPYKAHEQELGLNFLDFETRNISGHFQTSRKEAAECARLLESVAIKLRARCGGRDVYTRTRPDTHHIVVCEHGKSYLKYLDYFSKKAGHNDENWIRLAKETASFGSDNVAIIRRDRVMPPAGSGINHMVVYSFGLMLVKEATDGKAPNWFQEGFASFSESLVLKQPRCYSIRYESNDVRFETNWAKAVADAVRARKVKPWSQVFDFDQIGMKAFDYQQCWSIVRFLYRADGKAFSKLPALFMRSVNSAEALAEAYGSDIQKLESAWRAWALDAR